MHSFGLKFILVGDSRVGKSQLSRNFTRKTFNNESQSTVGMEFTIRTLEFEKCEIKAQLWDTAGQERFDSMAKIYYKEAVGAALVFDVSNRQSFLHLRSTWLRQIREFGHESMKVVLVGNKIDLLNNPDLQREITANEAIEFAKEFGFDYIETSALTGQGVESMFRRMIFSVARLLPAVKVHLEVSTLPDGWILLPPKNIPVKDRQISEDIGGTTAETLSNLSSLPKSEPTLSPTSVEMKFMDLDSLSKTVYLNYWTGQTQKELPTHIASTNFLYISPIEMAKEPRPKSVKRLGEGDKQASISLDDRPSLATTERSSRAYSERPSSAKFFDVKLRESERPANTAASSRRCNCTIM